MFTAKPFQQFDLLLVTIPWYSYKLVSRWVCEYAQSQGLSCGIVEYAEWVARRLLYRARATVLMGMSKVPLSGFKAMYFPVDGRVAPDIAATLRLMCNMRTRCFVPSRYAQMWAQEAGINVDVAPHGIRWYIPVDVAVNTEKKHEIVYANSALVHSCCDRKGWVWYIGLIERDGFNALTLAPPQVQEMFAGRKMGFYVDITRLDEEGWDRHVATARVWANMSWGGAFEIGPVRALGLGLFVVTWHHPLYEEVLGKFQHLGCVTMARTYAWHVTDYVSYSLFSPMYMALDLADFAEKTRHMLAQWNPNKAVECAEAARRHYGLHLYKKLIEAVL